MSAQICIAERSVFRDGLVNLLSQRNDCEVVYATDEGTNLLSYVKSHSRDNLICLVGFNFKRTDGYEIIKKLQSIGPNVKSIALRSSLDLESSFKLLESGAKGQISKDATFESMMEVILKVDRQGYFHDTYLHEAYTYHLKLTKNKPSKDLLIPQRVLTKREKLFVQFCCTEMQYKEIADKMNISVRTVDKFREQVCQKLQIKGRVGIILYAIENGLMNAELMAT